MKVGDRVKVVKKCGGIWVSSMDGYIGKIYTIHNIRGGVVNFKEDTTYSFDFPVECLELCTKNNYKKLLEKYNN